MLSQLDPVLENFIQTYVASFIKWDLIVYFHENPDVVDSAHALAMRLGRHEAEVGEALRNFTHAGLLVCEPGTSDIYRYAPSKEIAIQVNKFVEALESRGKRLQMLTCLLRMGAR